MLRQINSSFAVILLCLKLGSMGEAAVNFRGQGPAKPCSPDICKLPDCRCSGVDIPGNLPKEKVPQMVMLSFDDDVGKQNFNFYKTLFADGELKNPNGCNATATFFVSHEYTEYQMVQELYHNRHDIADHTISHRTPTSWWKSANYSQLTDEIVGQREILRKWGQVEAEDVVGFRAPFLQIGGNTMYQVLYDNKFLYDSSMPTQKFMDPPMWPYTLEYRSTQECAIPPCPTDSFPGLWEVPLVDYNDSRGFPCDMIDACLPPPASEQDVYDLLSRNFERHYMSTSRAPFPMFMHASWIQAYPIALTGKVKALKLLSQNRSFVNLFQEIGMHWQLEEELFEKIQEFTCTMYSSVAGTSDANEMRYRLFCARQGKINSNQLPPCADCLKLHAQRANYQAAIWRRSLQPCPEVPTPVDHGWLLDGEGGLSIKWMTGDPAPTALLEFLSCTCTKTCSAPNCTCITNGLKCTDMCRLLNCENRPPEDEEEEEQDPADNQEETSDEEAED